MLRVDDEDLSPISSEKIALLLDAIGRQMPSLDAVLISDYKKGLIDAALVQGIRRLAGDTPILVDPARVADYSLYRGVRLICPNRYEAELASGIPCRDLDGCRRAAARLLEDVDLEAVAITLDRDGIFLGVRGGHHEHFPTSARVVADVTGAGDMVLTVLGIVAAVRGKLEDAVRLANVAAGIEVRYFGVTPISREELCQELRYQGHPVVGKIKTLAELEKAVGEARRGGKTVVFTNGCFDLLHPGHHHLLNGARREGDLLVVAVNSDASIRRLKGPSRPRIKQEDRIKMLAGMEAVDYVILFEDDTPNRLLEAVRPDVLVKGSEYRDGVVVGREIVEGYGGRVAFVEQLAGFSTTQILGRDIAQG
jgi:D-beta-D-heptose 7-phosphate kinase/D-beta-D-heptose 1-phosphate adenosyltransferase